MGVRWGMLLALACSASGGDAAQLLVVIDSDLGERLRAVRVVVDDPDPAPPIVAIYDVDGIRLPLSFGVAPRDDDASRSVVIRAQGLAEAPVNAGGSEPVILVERIARVGFIRGQSLVLRLFLAGACEVDDCDEETTCDRGACVDPNVDPESLPRFAQEEDPDAQQAAPPPPRSLALSPVTNDDAHACALEEGTFWCWGRNESGQLAAPPAAGSFPPVRVPSPPEGRHWVELSLGWASTCGLSDAGIAYCWGSNAYGQLGVVDAGGHTFVRIEGGPYASIDSGFLHTCALSRDRSEVWCWGDNSRGQCAGRGSGRTTPTRVAFPEQEEAPPVGRWAQIDAGKGNASCALARSGDLWCWGSGREALLGPECEDIVPPRLLLRDVATSAGGNEHRCVRFFDGRALCFGQNYAGQLGRGFFSERGDCGACSCNVIPPDVGDAQPSALGRFALGVAHSCALTAGGEAHCWGIANNRQTGQSYDDLVDRGEGIGTSHSDPRPVRLDIESRFVELAGGLFATCGRTTEGAVRCWGGSGAGEAELLGPACEAQRCMGVDIPFSERP